MGYGWFAPARPSRWVLAVFCLAGALAGCYRIRSGPSGEPPAYYLAIASQHHFGGNLLTGG
jgi:hypothetical protein